MISLARFGPVSAAAEWPGSSSLITCVIRSSEPRSNPLARLTTGIHGRRYGRASVKMVRNPCVGTPTTSRSTSWTAFSRSAVAFSAVGSVNPARYRELASRS